MEIRFVNENDSRDEISRVYEESWKSAYKDIIPKSYLDSIPKGQWITSLDDNIGGKDLREVQYVYSL